MKKILFVIFIYLIGFNKAYSVIINDLKTLNNKRITKETIVTYGNIKFGNDYTNEDLNKILKNLYDTDFFENITLKVEDNTLVLNIKENKLIQSVNIEGIKSNRIKNAILENLYSKDKAPFLIEKVKIDLRRIINSLKTVGYYTAEVNSKIIENNNETVSLIFEVNLGEKALISKIEFLGDKKIKSRTLRSAIISEEAKFWKFISNNKYLNEDTIDRDIRLLSNFYLQRGYFDVKIESAAVEFKDDNTFKLSYKIDAGEIYKINDAKLILPTDYDPKNFEDVIEVLNKLKQKQYSLNSVTKIIEEIDKISLSRQYDFINADLLEKKVGDNKIDLVFEVSESERLYIERINIVGNNITHESVIRNNLEIDEGDPFNKLLNAKSLNNLKSSKLFKSVVSNIEDGQVANTKVVNIEVEEQPTGEISIGAGAGSDGGTVGFSVVENNFLGKGVKLGTSLRLTEDSVKGSFSVVNPNFNYSNKSLSTVVESTAIDKLTDNGYKSTKTGFSFGTGFEQFQNVYFSPKISSYYEDLSTNSKASANLKKQSGEYFETKFSYGLNYDMRNQRFQTSEGFRSQFGQSIPLYSDEYSFSNSYDFKTWHKLPNNMVTSFNIYGKMINSLNGEDVRISNRTFLPKNKLKGFNTRNIGPRDGTDYVGGNYAAAINFDTTLPMVFSNIESLDMRYFIDMANLWGVDYSSSVDQSSEIRASTGVVIDWFTPIGPLNLSFAQDINKAQDDKTEFFQFNLGTTF